MEFLSVLLAAFLLFFVEGIIYSKNMFKGVSYTCTFSTKEAMEGDEITLTETISNCKFLPLPWLKAEITASKWLDFANSQSLLAEETRFVPSFFVLKSNHRITRTWKVRCLKRGIYQIDKVVLVSSDLIGRSCTSIAVPVEATVTVLPRPVSVADDFYSYKKISGDVLVRRHLIYDPFLVAGVREYSTVDPQNRIHWLSSARCGRLMVRNNEFTAERNLVVILNMQSRESESGESADKQKLEDAIRLCAGCFDETVKSGLSVRFLANGSISGQRECTVTNDFFGAEHVHDLMRLLAGLPLRSSESFSSFLKNECDFVSASEIIIVTAYLSDAIYDFARRKTERGASVRILYSHPVTDEAIPSDCRVTGWQEADTW